MKTALITGASSGLGAEFARQLSAQGWRLILVARRTERLAELRNKLGTPCRIITADLSDYSQCRDLYEQTRDEHIDLLINNAGMGLFGDFDSTDLAREQQMLAVNCGAVLTLTKLWLPDFIAADSGTVLNVASSAAFAVGPLLSGYYASKAYVLKLSQSVDAELRKRGSKVRVVALCPGPVDTEFNSVAGAAFSLRGKTAEYVVSYALKKLRRGKRVICPGFEIRAGRLLARLSSDKLLGDVGYAVQNKKR